MPTLDLVGAAEVAEMLDVSRQYVNRLQAKPGFPRPVAELAAGRIWKRGDIERWTRRTGRLE